MVRWEPEKIDVWTRAFAEDQARQAGMPVRDWLNQFAAQETVRAEAGVADRALSAPPEVCEETQAEAAEAGEVLQLTDPLGGVRGEFGHRGEQPDAPAANAELGARGAPSEASLAHEPEPEIEETPVQASLRRMREEMLAAEREVGPQRSGPVAYEAASLDSDPAGARASERAIAQLGLDIARLAEVVDCGLERAETESARQMADLRADVGQMFDELAARLEAVERRAGGRLAQGFAHPSPEGAPYDPDVDLFGDALHLSHAAHRSPGSAAWDPDAAGVTAAQTALEPDELCLEAPATNGAWPADPPGAQAHDAAPDRRARPWLAWPTFRQPGTTRRRA